MSLDGASLSARCQSASTAHQHVVMSGCPHQIGDCECAAPGQDVADTAVAVVVHEHSAIRGVRGLDTNLGSPGTFTDANGVDLSPDETSVECRRVRDDPLGESRIGFEGAGIGWPEWTGAAQTSEYHFTRARVEVTDSVRAGFVCHRYLQPWTIDDDDLAADREQVDVIGEHCRCQARANSTTRRRNSRGCGRAIRTPCETSLSPPHRRSP